MTRDDMTSRRFVRAAKALRCWGLALALSCLLPACYRYPANVESFMADQRRGQQEGERVLAAMSDRDLGESAFEIRSRGVHLWYPLGFESILVELKPRDRGTVDALRWYLRVENGMPQDTWKSLMARYAQARALIQEQKWLSAWKSAAPGRTFELFFSDRGYAESDLEFFVGIACKHANFRGDPEFQLVLRRSGEACCTVYLSSRESSALLLKAKPGASGEDSRSHWLDQQEVYFHPTQPRYMTVTRDGRFEVKIIPETDPMLRELLQRHGARYQLSPDAPANARQ